MFKRQKKQYLSVKCWTLPYKKLTTLILFWSKHNAFLRIHTSKYQIVKKIIHSVNLVPQMKKVLSFLLQNKKVLNSMRRGTFIFLRYHHLVQPWVQINYSKLSYKRFWKSYYYEGKPLT